MERPGERIAQQSPGKCALGEAELSDDHCIPFLKQNWTPVSAGDKKGWVYPLQRDAEKNVSGYFCH